MTPPDHLLTGFSIGAFYSSICNMFSLKRLSLFSVLFLCGVFAVIPDADAFRGVYTSIDPFIGHRGITHSLLFVLSLSLITTIFFILFRYYSGNNHSGSKRFLWADLFLVLFFSGFSHLVLDLPQPPGIWKGIPLFFPLKSGDQFVRSGGWGNIGWYDYRITWRLFVSVTVSIMLILITIFIKKRVNSVRILSFITASVCITSGIMITDIILNSSYKNSKAWNEMQSKYLEELPLFIKNYSVAGRSVIFKIINR